MMVNAETGEETEVVALSHLNEYISQTPYTNLRAFPQINWKNAYTFYFYHLRGYWEYNIQKRELKRTVQHADNGANMDYHEASDQIAYTIDNNLFIATPDKDEIQITNFDIDTVSGQAIHRYEFGISKGTFWSPDASRLAFYEKDESEVLNYSRKAYEVAPAADVEFKYPMAGGASEKARVGIYDLQSNKVVYLQKSIRRR